MGIPITTIGMKVSWCEETSAGTRPTTGYKVIHNLKEFPDTDVAPQTADATTFDQTKNTISVTLLQDLSGSMDITANLNTELFTEWEEMCDAYDTGKATGKKMWLALDLPDFEKSAFLPIEPSHITGFTGMNANSLAEQKLHFTVIGDKVMEADPTYAEETV